MFKCYMDTLLGFLLQFRSRHQTHTIHTHTHTQAQAHYTNTAAHLYKKEIKYLVVVRGHHKIN